MTEKSYSIREIMDAYFSLYMRDKKGQKTNQAYSDTIHQTKSGVLVFKEKKK